MKKFHVENGKEIVCVQRQDIMYLVNETNISVPEVIAQKIITDVNAVDISKRLEFIKFEEKEAIEFFKKIEFIIDFNKYQKMNYKQLAGEIEQTEKKSNKILEQWNSMNEIEKEENGRFFDEYCNICYMKQFLYEISTVICRKNKLTVPLS